jgi:protein SCO1/2
MSTTRTSRGRSNGVAIVSGVFAVFLLGAGAMLWLTSAPPTAPAIGGPFSLTGGDGATVTEQDLKGRYALIYFGYTACPDVCPTTLQEIVRAMAALGARAEDIQPVFITVDPARDTPDAMAAYTKAFGGHILGLTGSAAAIDAVEKEFHVYAARRRTGPNPGDYTVDHSSVLYLMGPDGRFLAPIRADEPGPAMAADIAKHLS